MNETPEVTAHMFPARIKPAPMERANALIGAALQISLRGRVLLLVRAVWLVLVAATLALFGLTIPARYSQLVILGAENSIALQELGLSQNVFTLLIGAFDSIAFLTYTIVGALIFSRKGHEWIGLFSSLTLITAVFAIVRPADSLLFVDQSLRIPLLIVLAIAAVTITVFAYFFPDGNFIPRWTRWIVLGLCIFAVYGLVDRIYLTRPFRWPPAPLSPVIYLGILGGVIVQFYRYRRVSDPTQKQQMKWVILGLGLGAFGLIGFLMLIPALLPQVALPGMSRVLYVLIGLPIFYLCILALPFSLTFSILRYRLWEINLIISRTLIYLLLTGILTGLFAMFEKITQDLFVAFTGAQSDFAPILSTLIVVAAFTPLKEALQKVVQARVNDASDPLARLKTFRERVETRISPLQPVQISRRLALEAISAYNAKGGAVYVVQNGESKLVQAWGDWDGEAALMIPLTTGPAAHCFGFVALDDRKNGARYAERDRKALTEAGQHVARALEEDAVGATSTATQ